MTITLDNGIKGCGAEEKDADWFNDPGRTDAYTQHLLDLVTRYKGDSTIAWFEYLNEPSWAGGALRTFYDQEGAKAKAIDPDRLFATGTIAPYALDGDDNFRNLSASPGVDIVSLHEYDANEVESHWGPEVIANSDGKPVIVGEFGVYASVSGTGNPGDGQDCQATVDQRESIIRNKAAYYIGPEHGYIGAIVWAWHPGNPLEDCNTSNLAVDDGVGDTMRTLGTNG